MTFETEKDLTPEEEPVTSRDEAGEPSGRRIPQTRKSGSSSEPEDSCGPRAAAS